jgi:hypothetical protein
MIGGSRRRDLLHIGLWKTQIANQRDNLSNPVRDPKDHRWVSAWSETRVTAEFRRAEIERRFARKNLEVQIERFELNSGKSDIVRFLNEHADA